MDLKTIEQKQDDLDKKFSDTLLKINKTLIQNDLNNELIYELSSLYHTSKYNSRINGVEYIKQLYKI